MINLVLLNLKVNYSNDWYQNTAYVIIHNYTCTHTLNIALYWYIFYKNSNSFCRHPCVFPRYLEAADWMMSFRISTWKKKPRDHLSCLSCEPTIMFALPTNCGKKVPNCIKCLSANAHQHKQLHDVISIKVKKWVVSAKAAQQSCH